MPKECVFKGKEGRDWRERKTEAIDGVKEEGFHDKPLGT